MIALWVSSASAATDPLLEGIPRADEVTITRGAAEWIAEIHGERYTLQAPHTPAEEALLRTWIASLLQEIDLSQSVPSITLPEPPADVLPQPVSPEKPKEISSGDEIAPAIVAPEAAAAPPAPEGPPAAPLSEPSKLLQPERTALPAAPAPPAEPRAAQPPQEARRAGLRGLSPWIGPALVLRSSIDPGGSLAVGLSAGHSRGGALRLSGVAPRPTRWGEETRLGELCAEIELWSDIRELRAFVGAGTAVRRWSQGAEAVAVTPMPRASIGGLLPALGGGLLFGGAAEADLGRTWIGPLGDRSGLLPVSARIEIRIAPRIEPKAEDAT